MGSVLNCADRQSGTTCIARQNPCQAGLSRPISDDAPMTRGTEQLIEYRYPGKAVQRYVGRMCGAMLFNTSAYDWLVVSQSLLRHPPYRFRQGC